MNEVTVGSKVRSHDFPHLGKVNTGDNAYYVEGVVIDIHPNGVEGISPCPVYEISVSKRICGGLTQAVNSPVVYAPMNGTPSWLGGETNSVEVV